MLPSKQDSGQLTSGPPSGRNSMDSAASGGGGGSDSSANPYAFLFPGEPAAPAEPQPDDLYSVFAPGGAIGGSDTSSFVTAAGEPPNPFASPPASVEPSEPLPARAKSEGATTNPYAFLMGPPGAAAEAAGSAGAPSPYASFTSNASAPPATNGNTTMSSTSSKANGGRRLAGGSPPADAANPYALFTAGSSPPSSNAANPYAAFEADSDRGHGSGDAAQQQPRRRSNEQAAEAVMGLAAAARQYRASTSSSGSDSPAAINPFNNVPVGNDWRDVNGGAGGAPKAQVLPVARMDVSHEGRCDMLATSPSQLLSLLAMQGHPQMP